VFPLFAGLGNAECRRPSRGVAQNRGLSPLRRLGVSLAPRSQGDGETIVPILSTAAPITRHATVSAGKVIGTIQHCQGHLPVALRQVVRSCRGGREGQSEKVRGRDVRRLFDYVRDDLWKQPTSASIPSRTVRRREGAAAKKKKPNQRKNWIPSPMTTAPLLSIATSTATNFVNMWFRFEKREARMQTAPMTSGTTLIQLH
jgi:hypothetical protein